MKKLTNSNLRYRLFSKAFFCNLCRAPTINAGLCDDCINDLPCLNHGCDLCGIELPETGLCGACIQTRPLLDRTVCAYKYTYPIDSIVRNIKYKQSLTYLPALVSRLCDQITKFSCVKIDLLLPVPMPRTRMVIRGMNQATVIARMVSRELNIPVDYFGLKRTRYTPPMHSLDARQRHQNARNAFAWTGPATDSVAIIDDIITSGSTCSSICSSLKAGGVRHVEAWALSRVC